MIETEITFDMKTGNYFISRVKFVEPFEYDNGVHIEKIQDRVFRSDKKTDEFMAKLGFVNVGRDPAFPGIIYARKGFPSGWYKFCEKVKDRYYKVVKWLYFHGSLFQPIPQGEVFSLSYFTPVYFLSPYIKRYKSWIDNIGMEGRN